MTGGYELSSLDSPPQITGHHGIQWLTGQSQRYLPCLVYPSFIQLTLSLSLHDLTGIIHRFTMPYQKNCCLHACKVTEKS